MVAGFLPAFTRSSINARIVIGSAGKYGSPRLSQNAWKIAPSAFWARSVLGEYAPSASACHSKSSAKGPRNTGGGANGTGRNSSACLGISDLYHFIAPPHRRDNCNYHARH